MDYIYIYIYLILPLKLMESDRGERRQGAVYWQLCSSTSDEYICIYSSIRINRLP